MFSSLFPNGLPTRCHRSYICWCVVSGASEPVVKCVLHILPLYAFGTALFGFRKICDNSLIDIFGTIFLILPHAPNLYWVVTATLKVVFAASSLPPRFSIEAAEQR